MSEMNYIFKIQDMNQIKHAHGTAETSVILKPDP